MLKFQILLMAVLIACFAFVSCDRTQKMLDPVTEDMMADDATMVDDDMMVGPDRMAGTDMMKMMDSTMYMSWAHVMLPAPGPLGAATNPVETGGVHGLGTRTAYINDIGVMANKSGTMYPAGTMIVKTIMDDTNTFVAKKALMMKSDDPMYAGHNGWGYKKYARSSADGEYMQVKGSNLEDAGNGCHGCHAKADNDSVFISLPMDDGDVILEVVTDADGAGTAGESTEENSTDQ